jgi:hypothetical protein
MKTMNKLSLIKSINNPTQMKSTNSLSPVKTIIEQVTRMRWPRRPIVFIRVRCGMCSVSHPDFIDLKFSL